MPRISLAVAAALGAVILGSAPMCAQTPQNWGQFTASTAVVPLGGVPTALTADQAWRSACLSAVNARAFSVFAALTKAGTVQVQRFADSQCAQPIGAAVPPTALVLTNGAGCPSSSYCGSDANNDGMPFLFEQVTLTDTSNSSNAVVALILHQGAE